ncbi:hypothetical protein CHS0354_005912 [Potamilus streckersoni]|uniref:Uncharacterized protein n=1 Tax=Potamilus streckersoni TaxID=2493646 RepID=A0AAE0T2R3_9BIVA|nr:hypothetical protein CHS0354_005912 [Potamilus streckersoni]
MICFLVVLLVVSFGPVQGTVCKSDVDCGTGECCYIPSRFLVVSRRAAVDAVGLPLEPFEFSHQNGVCELYKLKGESCSFFEKANGHCSCGHGLHCGFVPANQKRSVINMGPGTIECVADAA